MAINCPLCRLPLCPICGRCPAAGHTEQCKSEAATQARAWIASLEETRERAVGAPATLLQELLRKVRR